MKIGFDVHGVLSNKDQVCPLLEALKSKGFELCIISGAPVIEIIQELTNNYGYEDLSIFSEIYSIINFVKSNYPDIKVWNDKNGWWIDSEEIWWQSKSLMCERYNIDLLIDNELKYDQGYLKGRFILYDDKLINQLNTIIRRIK